MIRRHPARHDTGNAGGETKIDGQKSSVVAKDITHSYEIVQNFISDRSIPSVDEFISTVRLIAESELIEVRIRAECG